MGHRREGTRQMGHRRGGTGQMGHRREGTGQLGHRRGGKGQSDILQKVYLCTGWARKKYTDIIVSCA